MMMQWVRLICAGAIALGAHGLTGCSSSPQRDTCSIEGAVICDGKPVAYNRVVFVSGTAGASAEAFVGVDGEFKINGLVPPGTYLVTILPPAPRPLEEREKSVSKSAFAPEKYRDEKTTDLKVDVVSGKNRFQFELKQ